MNQQAKRIKELFGYARTLTKEQGIGTMCVRAAGGLDEAKFAVAYNDVDYCLKLWQKGLLNVYTPRAEAYHYESKSRGLDTTPENAARYAREKANFYTKYHEYIDHYDPYYNPHFNNLFENFGLK